MVMLPFRSAPFRHHCTVLASRFVSVPYAHVHNSERSKVPTRVLVVLAWFPKFLKSRSRSLEHHRPDLCSLSTIDQIANLLPSVTKPHLEYASPVWNPFHKGEIENNIENAQKFALKICLKLGIWIMKSYWKVHTYQH